MPNIDNKIFREREFAALVRDNPDVLHLDGTKCADKAHQAILLDGRSLQWDAFRRLYARRDDRPVFLAE